VRTHAVPALLVLVILLARLPAPVLAAEVTDENAQFLIDQSVRVADVVDQCVKTRDPVDCAIARAAVDHLPTMIKRTLGREKPGPSLWSSDFGTGFGSD
jgi:cytochrome c556